MCSTSMRIVGVLGVALLVAGTAPAAYAEGPWAGHGPFHGPEGAVPPQEKRQGAGEEEAAAADQEKEDELSTLIARVLRRSPQVRLARAKLEQARAELDLARQEASHRTVQIFLAKHRAEQVLATAQDRYMRIRTLRERGAAGVHEALKAKQELVEAKSQLAQASRELELLLTLHPGGGGSTGGGGGMGAGPRPPKGFQGSEGPGGAGSYGRGSGRAAGRVSGPEGKFRDVLLAASFEHHAAGSPKKLARTLETKVKGLKVFVDPAAAGREGGWTFAEESLELVSFDDVPLHAALQLLEDTLGVRFLWRDYGLLLTDPEGAKRFRERSR